MSCTEVLEPSAGWACCSCRTFNEDGRLFCGCCGHELCAVAEGRKSKGIAALFGAAADDLASAVAAVAPHAPLGEKLRGVAEACRKVQVGGEKLAEASQRAVAAGARLASSEAVRELGRKIKASGVIGSRPYPPGRG